ncbi:NAD(+) diphosphatase [Pseudonocardia eucalypti]|uniref:NAD(+) diphosphatase n=1 Tax=Pseudonocardia eucalypti TaxID=648755 RepID=A0ABP9Q9I4_9PSEU|nr:NAD+ diphosphatase [Pseudonocardia eucalypti]
MSFPITEPPRLSRATVRRDEQLRLDTAWQASTWPKARVLVVDEKGRSPVEPGGSTGSVALTKAGPEVSAELPVSAVLIGEQDDVPYWAVRGQPSLLDGDDPSQWQDLRMCGAALDATSAGLMVSAVAVLNWHDNAGFCARCGARTEVRQAGWLRVCTGCGREEYPRTDPAIICLVHDGGTGGSARVLLARQPMWPPGRFSVLAGFVEAGESLEACVAREIQEEVGVTVTDIRYLASQAWPFPRSIMIGFEAVADPSQPLSPADGEIAEAFWLTRDELRRALVDAADATRDWATEPGDGRLLVPPSISIARTMLDSWSAVQD